VKYTWIAKNKAAWPVTMTCEVLSVSTSGYFEHQRRRRTSQPSQPGGGRLSNEALLAHIRAIHAEVSQPHASSTSNARARLLPALLMPCWASGRVRGHLGRDR